jgi:uncharacterized repeat protein (TIGR04076 family)
MKRRQFCKVVPCAVMAATYPAFLYGKYSEDHSIKEESMSKTITAVQAKVIKGSCALHKIGDVAEFTESGVKGKICIHALYSMMPAGPFFTSATSGGYPDIAEKAFQEESLYIHRHFLPFGRANLTTSASL